MTTSVKPLGLRLMDDEDPFITDALGQAGYKFVSAGMRIQNPVTEYDFGLVMETLYKSLTSGIEDGDDETPAGFAGLPSPARTAADNRPLYLRIDEEADAIGQSIREVLAGLQLIAVLVKDNQTRDDYIATLNTFWAAMGLPTAAEKEARPDLYSNIEPSVLRQLADALGE